MTARWSVEGRRFTGVDVAIRQTAMTVSLPHDPFRLILKDGTSVAASDLRIVGGTRILRLAPIAEAVRAAEGRAGQCIVLRLEDKQRRFRVSWRGIMRDDSNYFRQEVSISAMGSDQDVEEVRLFDSEVPGARVVGVVKGSPVTAGDLFFGFEHPLASCEVHGTVICSMKRQLPLKQGQTVRYGFVMGVSQPGQMRRSFLNYLEQERARPYRPFLHYNSWYDIGYGSGYSAVAVQGVIEAFGTELVRKRGVRLDSFLLDDGWDDPNSLWHFNSGFPQGAAPLVSAAKRYRAGIGMWLSPWGGYNEAKQKRLDYGRRNGFETNAGGFALSGPKYYEKFEKVARNFIQRDGVNQFKIDGTGNVNTVVPGSSFDSDFAAAISLIQEWRRLNPKLYVNLTTGTYPSPFWLQNADSIWRGGEDHSFAGVGSWRERWITYRDQETYRGVVQAGPLFPLNSVMLHGLIYARQAEHLDSDPGSDFENEIHSYFGSGTQLQEMYVSHDLLSPQDWDLLAEAANWSRRNVDVLRDTHWLGGDPGKLEVYGWAAWSPAKAILTIRNPSDSSQTIDIDVGQALELPANAAHRFLARSPWKQDRANPSVPLVAGEKHAFTLRPFEVLNLELWPLE
jgi:hypothetical protein